MKLSATLSALYLLTASAAASNLFQQLAGSTAGVKAGGGGVKVPGESPLEHCGSTSGDILTVHKINLFPNPPVPGQNLTIEASGTLHDTVTKGAMVELIVKYGYITLIKQKLDLCEHLGEIDLECPVKPGKFSVTKIVDIPRQIPPGKYGVSADAYLDDGRPLTCMIGTVLFT